MVAGKEREGGGGSRSGGGGGEAGQNKSKHTNNFLKLSLPGSLPGSSVLYLASLSHFSGLSCGKTLAR